MHENDISGITIDCALKVHKILGPGLLESVYQAALAYELEKRGLKVVTEQAIPAYMKKFVLISAFAPI